MDYNLKKFESLCGTLETNIIIVNQLYYNKIEMQIQSYQNKFLTWKLIVNGNCVNFPYISNTHILVFIPESAVT